MTQAEWALSLFGRRGFFVEAGAHDGIGDSNTYALEQAGWAGICVEPSSAFFGLQRSRKCKVDDRCLWGADGEIVTFVEVAGNGVELSGIAACFGDQYDRLALPHREVRKPTVTLTTLLEQHGAPPVIEYLSLDTEGSELNILSAHDWSRYRFRALTVEHNGVAERRAALASLLAARGYVQQACEWWRIEDWYLWSGGA